MAIFSFFFFILGNIGQENLFYDIVERENEFRGYKNKKCEKSKNLGLCKGLVHGFDPKFAIFPSFFYIILVNIGQENLFYDIVERENEFRGYKNKKCKKLKNLGFCKRLVHGFVPKLAIFPSFLI